MHLLLSLRTIPIQQKPQESLVFFFFFGVQNIADDLFAIITKSFGQFQTKQGTIFFHGFDP